MYTSATGKVAEFTDHKGGAVLLISTKAGNVGLNIACATAVIMMEPEWNPDVCKKSRSSPKKNVNTIRFLIRHLQELTEQGKTILL